MRSHDLSVPDDSGPSRNNDTMYKSRTHIFLFPPEPSSEHCLYMYISSIAGAFNHGDNVCCALEDACAEEYECTNISILSILTSVTNMFVASISQASVV